MAVFGKTTAGIHLGLLVANAFTIVLVFFLGRRLLGDGAGLAASAVYAVMSLSKSLLGFSANAEHFVLLTALGGILLLLRAVDSGRLGTFFLSGVLLGLAFIIKQHGIFFTAFALAYLLYVWLADRSVTWTHFAIRVFLLLGGAALLFGMTCFYLYLAGVFDNFWFWTFTYSRQYVSIFTLSEGWLMLKLRMPGVIGASILLWGLAAVGVASLPWCREKRSARAFVALLLLFSILSVTPGFYFRPHYFILLLPAFSLLAGIAAKSAGGLFSGTAPVAVRWGTPVLLVGIALLYQVYGERAVLFQMSPKMVSRAVYGNNPFPEAKVVAEHIRENFPEDVRVAVLGSEPEIYFYSKRRSATSYVYTAELMSRHSHALKMQQEMIDEIESARPEVIVYVKFRNSWLMSKDSTLMIFGWAKRYIEKHYALVGLAHLIDMKNTLYYWGDAVSGYSPKSENLILVFKRKNLETSGRSNADPAAGMI
jgi:4-amino-4-deoxy-L-arabinose transferase-like glycosyltransferase